MTDDNDEREAYADWLRKRHGIKTVPINWRRVALIALIAAGACIFLFSRFAAGAEPKCRVQRPTTCEQVRQLVACYGEAKARRLARLFRATQEELATAEACLKKDRS